LNFPFKNYIEKPYTTFLEKVDFFTRNPTKLDLHFFVFLPFLMVFRSFSSNPNNPFTAGSLEDFLEIAHMPLGHEKHPGINGEDAM
jgi:hypothetical protein